MSQDISLDSIQRINSVQYIITNFSSLNTKQKIQIKTLGRPTPIINLTQNGVKKKEGRFFIRHFNERTYQKNNWICGCDVKNSIFCFPCLLFYSSNKDRNWSRIGVTDLNHLQQKIKKHELSKYHLQACMEFTLLDDIEIAKDLSCGYHLKVAEHNEDVKKNRHILRSLISCLKFHAIFQIALQDHEDDESSLNRGIFKDLMKYNADFNNAQKKHIKNSKMFNKNSKTIENELLDCMLTVCKTEILKEVSSADFLAVQCEETTDVSNHCQTAVIFRYIKENTLREHFWTFLRIFDNTTDGLVDSIQPEIDVMLKNNATKLIAFACSGVFRESIENLREKMSEKYQYVHCYIHDLNLVIEKAASQHAQIRVFFNDLSRIKVFVFNTNRNESFSQILKLRLSSVTSTSWTSNSSIINTVHELRENLIMCFQEISKKTVQKSIGEEGVALIETLEDYQFIFWLTFFHKIYPKVDKLHDQFQSKYGDNVTLSMRFSQIEASILNIRNEIEVIDQECMNENIVKRKRWSESDRMSILAKEVCDVIVIHLKNSFSFRGHCEASHLVTNSFYTSFDEKFPNKLFNKVVKLYPMLTKERLISELELAYSRTEFSKTKTLTDTLEFISKNKLENIFSEYVKLLKIVITTPKDTLETERSFSTLKRLKAFLRKSVSNDRLNAWAMMSINRNFVNNISNFDEKVFDLFVNLENRKMDFLIED